MRIRAAVAGARPCRMLPQQSRFETGEFKGFTESPGEHIINRHETPVRTALFKGSVVDPLGAPIPGAIVEVRGPGQNETVKGALTDNRGRFKLGHLHRGSYAFKITSNGFQF